MSTPSTSLALPFMYKPSRLQHAIIDDLETTFGSATVNYAIARPGHDGRLSVLVSADDTAVAHFEITREGLVTQHQLIDFYDGWTAETTVDASDRAARHGDRTTMVYNPTAEQRQTVTTIEDRYPTSTTYVHLPVDHQGSIVIDLMLDDAAYYSFTIHHHGEIIRAEMLEEFGAGWQQLSFPELQAELSPTE